MLFRSMSEPRLGGGWLAAIEAAHADGFDYLDLLTAVDRPERDEIEVVAVLLRTHDAALMTLRTSCDRSAPVVESISGIFPAATWSEREVAEMFGLEFVALADSRPLLLHGDGHPLRKDFELVARAGLDPRGRGR